jgi:hypothetical protein
MTPRLTESAVVEILRNALEDETVENEVGEEFEVRTVRSFEEAGVLTMNAGIVIRLVNGQEFQLTVVQSR